MQASEEAGAEGKPVSTKEQAWDVQQGVARPRELLCTADRSGRLAFVSGEWQLALGWTTAELTSRPLIDFIHPGDRPGAAAAIATAMNHGGSADLEGRFRARGGDWRRLRMRIESHGDSWLARAIDVTDERRAEEQLRAALVPERLIAHAQPILASGSGALVQEELLVRMRAPEDPQRVLAPAEFIPPAERLGLITLVDRQMVAMGVEMATRGRRAAVNLSARSILDPAFMEEVEEAVRYAGRYAPNLVFEITETVALEQLDAAADVAQRLTALGVGFALDDFGTGHGSLTELRALPIQFLKIDAQFVQNAMASQRDRAMVSGIAALARQLGVLTVAEGIEDAATLRLVGNCGVDCVQGFFLGVPGPIRAHPQPRRPLRRTSSPAARRSGRGGLATGWRATTRKERPRLVPGLAAAALGLVVCAVVLALTGVLSGPRGDTATSSVAPLPNAGARQAVAPPQDFMPPGIFGAPLDSNGRH
jgi:PAS domain S-box-containing protein